MKLIKEMGIQQKIFAVISVIYFLVESVLCVVCEMVNYGSDLFNALILVFIFGIMQVFTPFIALFISCVLPNLVWNLAWEVLGLFVNLIGIPIMYILFTLKNSVSGGYTFLYELQWGWFASFVVVILVKMIMDIVAFLKRRKMKQSA